MTAWLLSRLPHISVAAAMAIAIGYTYHTGRSHGRALAELECAQIQQQRDARDAESARVWTAHLDALDQQRRAAEERAARAATQTVTEYLPGRLEVRREIVERAVYRDCVVSDRMRDVINAALGGHPVANGVPES